MKRIYRIYKETPAETFYDYKGMLRVAEKIASRNSLDPDPIPVKEFDSETDATAFFETCKPIINIYRGYGSVKELQIEFFSLQAIDIDDDDDETADYITDNSPTLDEILAVIDPQDEEEEN